MKNHNFLKLLFTLLFLSAFFSFTNTTSTFAEGGAWFGAGVGAPGGGWGGGGGGSADCYNSTEAYKWRVDCTGVSWAFYKATAPTIYWTTLPYVHVPGAINGVISPQCSENNGGFWHLGINSHGAYVYNNTIYTGEGGYYGHWTTISWNYLTNYSWVNYNVASGIPLQQIDVYRLDHYGTYDEVLSAFQKAYRNEYGEPPSSLPGDLYAFCDWDDPDTAIEYFGLSNTSNGITYKTTSYVSSNEAPKSTEMLKRTVTIDEPVPLVFSHNIYASKSDSNNTSWSVNRWGAGFALAGNPTIMSISRTEGVTSGSTPITRQLSNTLYSPQNLPYTDGQSNFIARDQYTITFHEAGSYTFCESLYMNNSTLGANTKMTTACSNFEVKEPATVGECSTIPWFSQSPGVTSVASAVRNNNASSYSAWSRQIYAKPTDDVEWLHCYYPGVQSLSDTIVSSNHPYSNHSQLLPAGKYGFMNNVPISSFDTWDSYMDVSATNLRAPTPSRVTGSTGNTEILSIGDNYNIEYGNNKNKAGKTLIETSTPSFPGSISWNNEGTHPWTCDPKSCTYTQTKVDTVTYNNGRPISSTTGSWSGNACTIPNHNASCSSSCSGATSSSTPFPSSGNGVVTTTYTRTCTRVCYMANGCSHENDYIASNRYSGNSDHADVLVPYNFTNTASVSLKQSVAYAGETIGVNAIFSVRPRRNDTTDGTYATNVDNAQTRLIVYTSNSPNGSANSSYSGSNLCGAIPSSSITHDNCGTISGNLSALNTSGNINGSTSSDFGGSFNVFDVPAGEYYCAVAAVYPANSGYDTNMNPSGSNTWYVSAPSCVKIAKKPSLQVWGNSLYSAGTVLLNPSTKGVIDGIYGWTSNSRANTTVFGSWVELGIVANGSIQGLASGASTGNYGQFTGRTPVNNLGGSKEGASTNICIRSPLTMPNSPCGSFAGVISMSPGSKNNAMNAPNDKDKLVARFMNENITNAGVEYEEGVTSINEVSVNKAKTIVKVGDGDITINGNIIYDSNNLTVLTDIPKMIIYAKGDIKINCNVTRIDAVLIAGDKVDTCANGGDENDPNRSTQLKINGAVITNTMTAGRTYGSATGYSSTIPAEIINYDTSLYLWGAPRSDASSSGKLDTVYLKEVAPRY